MRELLDELASMFAAAGLPSPETDARLLVAHVTGTEPSRLVLAPAVPEPQRRQARELARRRTAGEPLQYLTGEAHFRHETLRVGPGVFIPRPETELLVDAVLEAVSQREPGRRRVVELCAGSGAISLALVREAPGVEVHAVELSREAWPWLVRNLEASGVHLVHADMAAALPELDGSVDVVVVNPPYVPEAHRDLLPADVRGVDPDLALFAGADGLTALRVVADVARRLLRPGGVLVTEHDESHQDQVVALLSEGFETVAGHRDLAGRPRYVTARRSGSAVEGWGA